jgi:TPR repeat protein
MYQTGKGVPTDEAKANGYYRQAASLGNFWGKQMLESAPLAEKGDAQAEERVGRLWLGGHGSWKISTRL